MEKIRELSLTNALTDAILLLFEIRELEQGCRRRLLILDSQIELLRQERHAWAREREELKAERIKLASLYQINMRVLNIVNAPPNAGEKKWQGKNSDHSRMLDGFAKSGS